ncbi:hypothetical protein CK214_23635 [Mesorhizobium sp. WSM3882]|nr:hypothetical protein CK214_23635 [Mesorhizobium sp. WSM3882]
MYTVQARPGQQGAPSFYRLDICGRAITRRINLFVDQSGRESALDNKPKLLTCIYAAGYIRVDFIIA